MSVRVNDGRRIPFFMVGKPDLARLSEVCESRMLPYARSVYFALLELANDQRTDQVAASRADLASRAGVSVATVKRCASALRDAALVTMEEVPGYPNVWTLVSPDVEGGSSGLGGGGSDRSGGRVQQTRGVGPADPPLTNRVQEGKNEELSSPTDSRASSDRDGVWRHYQATMPNGQRCRLNPARRLLIDRALKVRSAEECQQAITALSRSEYHVQNGYLDLKYALLGGGRSPNPEATIDRLIGQLRNGQLRSNGNGNGQRRYFDGRPWEQLSSAEKLSAQEMLSMDMDPADPETWKGDQTPARSSSGKSFTAATILSDEVGELVGATNGNGHA